MKREVSYKKIEKDLAQLNKALKTVKKNATVEKAIKNITENVNFQANELQNREKELEESRTYFQNFFNASPVALTLIGLDGKRIDCNPAMERLTGRKREELVNVPVEATYLKEEQPLVRKKLVDETIEKGYMYGFETHFKRPDDTELPIISNCSLLRNKKGKPQAIIYSASDVTELRNREEELVKARQFASSLFSNLPLPASLSDPVGVRLDVNEPSLRLYKRSKEEWIGAKLEDMYEKADTFKIWETIDECRIMGYSSCEAIAIRGDGTKFPVILNFSALKDREGKVTHIICTSTDITELRKHKEKARGNKKEG
jgi:PAS domain S-box-containing protein